MMLKRLVGVVLLAVVGCAHESSVLVNGAQPGQRVVRSSHSILWGLIGSDRSWDPRAQCPNGVAKVDVTGVFSLIGIYSSYDVAAWCVGGPQIGQGAAPGTGAPSQNPGGSVIIVR